MGQAYDYWQDQPGILHCQSPLWRVDWPTLPACSTCDRLTDWHVKSLFYCTLHPHPNLGLLFFLVANITSPHWLRQGQQPKVLIPNCLASRKRKAKRARWVRLRTIIRSATDLGHGTLTSSPRTWQIHTSTKQAQQQPSDGSGRSHVVDRRLCLLRTCCQHVARYTEFSTSHINVTLFHSPRNETQKGIHNKLCLSSILAASRENISVKIPT